MTHHSPARGDAAIDADELDVRSVPKPQRHPLIFARFDQLPVGGSFVLVNSHDPKHLREEFDRDHPGAYDWTYLSTGEERLWRIRITRRTATDLPRTLGDITALLADTQTDAVGAVWTLQSAQRQLDANVIRLRPGQQIDAHQGPDLDVLLHILHGSGEITTAADTVAVTAGALVWLPRRSERAILAGPFGLAYLSVHQRRPALSVGSPARILGQ